MTVRTFRYRTWFGMLLFPVVAGCGPAAGGSAATFVHDRQNGATPWSHARFDDADDKFTFAIFSDLNGGERRGVFQVAVAQLALLRPEFILGVGDLIDGGSEDRAKLIPEWESFDDRAGQASAPVFRVGGNHDLTNQTMRDVWVERYGARYYHFVYKNVLFMILDTEDNPPERMREIYLARAAALDMRDRGQPDVADTMAYYRMPERVTGAVGADQAEYFRQVLADHPGVRWTFLFMHKPVWQSEGDSGFFTVESALADRPYTLFNGHFHNLSHTIRNGRDYIMLGTTGGSQNAGSIMSFDHVTLVTMSADGPVIGHVRLDGLLDKTGHLPLGGDSLCFQASNCQR